MEAWRIDPTTGDLDVSNGQLHFVSGAERMAQQARVRLRFVLGEWTYNTAEGFPIFAIVGIKPFSPQFLSTKVREAIETIPGVRSVTDLKVDEDPESRTATVTFTAQAESGENFTVSEPFIIGG